MPRIGLLKKKKSLKNSSWSQSSRSPKSRGQRVKTKIYNSLLNLSSAKLYFFIEKLFTSSAKFCLQTFNLLVKIILFLALPGLNSQTIQS